MNIPKYGASKHKLNLSSGLSLIELLIALALSATLIVGVITVYLDSNQTSRLSASLAKIQESGRIATEIIARDVRMAGFQGCADPNSVAMNIIANDPPTADFFESTLLGWEVGGTSWANGTSFSGEAIETAARVGSDVIAIQRGDMVPIQVTGNMTDTNANIQVSGQLSLFQQNDVVLISDCENADLFRISSTPTSGTWAHASNVNTSNRLSQAYNETARIMRFSSTAYFVADTGREDLAGNPIFALYRQRETNAGGVFVIDELVEGVESMQILYGERLSSDNIRYVPAGTSGLDMRNVVAVKIGLLISDAERVQTAPDQQSYQLPGQLIQPAGTAGASVTHPADNRIRRTFESTINIRNRI
ncbi:MULTISPECIES: PilW family protein [Marinobacter]|jgi:type IV pilus assembly protein PilW|uniref:Type IV fimbrial biogenesis protein PilW n=1 Tax=Marinobacter excellens LAMA 842 TaxID=1306954 RepID=A0A137SAA8_9GAMM|nr:MULTISPECIES: PilW family protein [Marinobacter]KXO09376.1 Type IV fimbrial biogenesis protein PilW [Marinobacter excellens LAMA 842]MCD1631705.1 PilW family protein [Marinobacter shengliensis]